MAAEVVGRGALWAAFGALYKAVKDSEHKTAILKPTLERIHGKLEALRPLLEDIRELNEGAPEELLGFKPAMEKGVELVTDCSNVHGFFNSFFKKAHYTEKLEELDETLQRLIRILVAQGVRDSKETAVKLQEISDVLLRKLGGNIGTIGVTSSSSSKTASSGQPGHHQLPLDDDTVKKEKKVHTYMPRLMF